MVFGLDKEKSPYWNSINRNIKQLSNLSMDNIFVQNICTNYFLQETSKNKNWIEIARDYGCGYLKQELDAKFDKTVPILMTTEFILYSIINNRNKIFFIIYFFIKQYKS